MERQETFRGVSSLTLHIFAMACMLCDHLWATLLGQYRLLTMVGRLAFPVFAFLLVEGFFHTRDLKKYLLRLLVFALLSEVPFNLLYSGVVFYPFHQNVLWTFLIGLLGIAAVDRVRKEEKLWLTAIVCIAAIVLSFVLGLVTMVDYYGYGVLTVWVFYLFRGRKWWQLLGQALGLFWINCMLLKGLVFPVTVLGWSFELPQQGLAMLSLLPIWLYRGRQGPHNKFLQYGCYAFYPVHLLVLGLLDILL